jgi:hypothetical protein
MGMKSKTIKAILAKKMKDWASSIEDPAVFDLVMKNSIVTGGSIASMLLGEKVNDFDVYFRTRETALAVAKYYAARFAPKAHNGIGCKISVDDTEDRIRIVIKSAGIASENGTETPYQYFEGRPADEATGYVGDVMQDPGDIEDAYQETEEAALETEDDGKPQYRPVFMSTNAITLSHRLQIVLRFVGEPDEIHKNYDFIHCTNYWTSWDRELELKPAALEALLAKELRYVGSKYPICSVIRLRKFIRRGWTINAGQILKMVWQISELDLTDHKVLEDQLTGVDVAYFVQLVAQLKEKDPQKVNAAYLVEIIDRMF